MSHEPDPAESIAQLRAECVRLRERVAQLETQHRHDEELVRTLRMERDGCLELLKTFSRRPATEQEWQELLKQNDCKTLDQFLPQLEQLAR